MVQPAARLMVSPGTFGRLPDGRAVEAFTIRNSMGIELRAISWGGIITTLLAPDRDGRCDDIVLGFDELDPYLTSSPYFGCVVGRVANRIQGARFSLEGTTYRLAANDGPNHLHGGWRGFDKRLWNSETVRTGEGEGVRFSRVSADGEEGYPGRLQTTIQYLLSHSGELHVDYEAEADRTTVVNLTQHSYFNLGGDAVEDVLEHTLQLHADSFTPIADGLIPTGEIVSVAGTPFDFRQPETVGVRITQAHEQLRRAGGFDHNFVLRNSGSFAQAATLVEPRSGRVLDVFTDAPGIQFYSGNQLDGTIVGKRQHRYRRHAGLCLETQQFPDAPNQPNFPSIVLRRGERFRSHTMFCFRTASR